MAIDTVSIVAMISGGAAFGMMMRQIRYALVAPAGGWRPRIRAL